jgi:hypothetical protein
MSEGALHGITVLDLGQLVSAPYCAKLFADYGADVVKIEPPDGDRARAWGPFPKDERHIERSGLFFFLNTNKRGITLDLARPAGRDLLPRAREKGRRRRRELPSGPHARARHRLRGAGERQPVARRGLDHAVRSDGPVQRLERLRPERVST